MLSPRPLIPGDTIAIISPASAVNPDFIDLAADYIASQGYRPHVMPHAKGVHGSYSGSADERFADFSDALLDPKVRAILCARGGYGAIHLLPRLDRYYLESDPKWLIGFSDISAIHAMMARHNIISLHSPMARHFIPGQPMDNLFTLLSADRPSLRYTLAPHPLNHRGQSHGTLRGGNLAVLQALIDTPFDDLTPDSILLIEDIAEPIYKIERILWQLRLSGRLERLSGLIVGQFTQYNPDRNYNDIYSMIADVTQGCEYPIAFNAPFGHIDANMPILHGADTLLDVNNDSVTIIQRT